MAFNDKGNDVLVTSGYNFEGYSIVEYLGFYTGECALGTGFLSSLGAGFADFLGTNSAMYSGKLRQAKDCAVRELRRTVANIGGNAIIGLDIDYSAFSSDIMGVIANGTAVRIEKNQPEANSGNNDERKILVDQTNLRRPIRPVALYAEPASGNTKISIEIMAAEHGCDISGLMADLEIETIFEETFTITGLCFLNFKSISYQHFRSSDIDCNLDFSVLDRVKSFGVLVRKYIDKQSVVNVQEERMDQQDYVPEEAPKAEFNKEDILQVVENLSTAREIVEYMNKNFPDMDLNLLEQLERIANTERIYGNMQESAIQKIEEYFAAETES